MDTNKSVFSVLNAVDCNGHTEKKNGLTYLSWAWAWIEVKKLYPDATYTIYENAQGLFYHTDGKTCWVKTGVTINGLEMIEYLPVMDYRNKSIPLENVTSFDVNKTIQRSLTKACARHGLGLYIYAGEDLPENENEQPVQVQRNAQNTQNQNLQAREHLVYLLQKHRNSLQGKSLEIAEECLRNNGNYQEMIGRVESYLSKKGFCL